MGFSGLGVEVLAGAGAATDWVEVVESWVGV
jgi:hypothetical protein